MALLTVADEFPPPKIKIDLISLASVLPNFRQCDDTLDNSYFQIVK